MKKAWRIAAAVVAAVLSLGLASLAFAAVKPPAEASIKAAIVNLDEGTELQGQWVPMGRQLAAELVLQGGPFDWEMSTEPLAEAGLEDGTYRAVVTIPKQFSTEVTSLAASMDSGGEVVQAQIEVQTAPGANQDQADALELVARAATSALGGQLSSEVVSGLIGGFGEMGAQLGQAASGAHELADGVNQLAGGTAELADGAGQLTDGAGQAADGITELADGAGQLSDGAGQAADGLNQFAAGTGALVGGLNQSASGAQDLAGGTNDLADGAGALAQGANGLASGIDQYVGGVTQLAGGTRELANGVNEMTSQIDGLVSGIGDNITGIGAKIGEDVQAFLDANDITSTVEQIAQAAGTMGNYCLANPDERACSGLTPEQWQQVASPQFAQQLLDLIYALPQIIPEQANQVAGEIIAQVDSLLDPIYELGAGTETLASGAETLAEEGGNLTQGARVYADGVTQFAGGARELAGGTGLLADGLSQAARESGALVSGAQQAADGVGALAGGLGALADGADQAADGVGQLASGLGTFAQGTDELASGAGQLGGGATELADGLSTAVDMIPSYSEAQAQDIALGVTQPIVPPTVSTGVSALGAAAMALLLWLFSFFLAWVFPVFSTRVPRSVQPAWRLAFSTWWKPAVWSAGMGVVAGVALGFWAQAGTGKIFLLAGVGLFTAVVFSGVQQALAGALGTVGRVVSLAMFGVGMLVTAASMSGGTLAGLAQVLPVGLATSLLNSIAIEGLPAAGFAAVGLVIWAGLAYLVAIWATSRKRSQPTIAAGSVPA